MIEQLHEVTTELLVELYAKDPFGTSIRSIAEAAGVKPAWLSAFIRNKIPNPGVVHVQALRNYLAEVLGR